MRIREEYAEFDAERKFSVPNLKIADPKSCQCGEVLKGVIKPWDCKVFGTACTPETPLGALMVSSEGACAAYYQYGDMKRQRNEAAIEETRHEQRSVQLPDARPARGKVQVPTVTLAHGGGGKAMHDLIDDVFVETFDNAAARAARGPGAARSRRYSPRSAIGWPSPPIRTSSIRCSSPAATSASSPSAAP